MPAKYSDEQFATAFWKKVQRGPPAQCWNWTGSLRSTGYGVLVRTKQRQRKHFVAHRVAYELANGAAEELFVCHACDNKRCCNPSHLFLGTHTDNMRDRLQKGGYRTQSHAWFHRHPPRGELNVKAKLTYAKAETIRQRYEAGERMAALATEYGVTAGAIWFVVKRRHWLPPAR